MSYILVMFNKILLTEYDPTNTLYDSQERKGDPLNYRGIALVNIVTKIFSQIVHDRLEKWVSAVGLIPEEQASFR